MPVESILAPNRRRQGQIGGADASQEVTLRTDRLNELLGRSGAGGEIAQLLTQNAGLGRKQREFARNKVDLGRGALISEGFRVRDTNNASLQQAKDFLMQNFEANTGPSITDEDILRFESRLTDQAFDGEAEGLEFLRSHLGSAGITGGGFAAGRATNLRLQAFGEIASGKRDLRIFKAQQDASDALRNLQFGNATADFLARETDETGLAVLSEVLGIDLGVSNKEDQRKAARDAASAAELSGILGLAGSLGGAAIGRLG